MKKRILGVLIATTSLMMAESELMDVIKYRNYYLNDAFILIKAKETFLLEHNKVKIDKCSTYDDSKVERKYEEKKKNYPFGDLELDPDGANLEWRMLASLTPDIRKTMLRKGEQTWIRVNYCGIEEVEIEAKGKVHRFTFQGEQEAWQKYRTRKEYVKFDERGEI